jgi:transcriptional regulator with XRE-family HTH domain
VSRDSFGACIAGLRHRAGLTQAEVAERAGLSVRSISNIERRVHGRPRRDTVVRLATALDLSADQMAVLHALGDPGRTAVEEATTPLDELPWNSTPSEWSRPGGGVPAQLPMAAPDLVGRQPEIGRVAAAFTDPGERAPGSPRVCTLSGPIGAGTTALAVHVAHRLRRRYPDGQLFLPVGADTGRIAMEAVRAFGVPDHLIPPGLPARAALLRTVLADRRALLVLDGAAGEAEVRPLIPGAAGCGVLITGHRRLVGLEGARHVTVGPLCEDAARALISSTAGDDWTGGDPSDATALGALARRCGLLPLALRIAGAVLSARPGLSPVGLTRLLATRRRPLDLLAVRDLSVRSRFAAGYACLDDADRRAFRLVATTGHADLSPGVDAALTDVLDRIADSGLLYRLPVSEGPRYHLSPLLRDFARELTEDLYTHRPVYTRQRSGQVGAGA